MGTGPYTYTPPAGWEDVTTSSETLPAIVQLKQGLKDKGASFVELAVFQAPTGDNVMILYSSLDNGSPSLAALDGFDRGARGTYAAKTTETEFKVDRTATLHVSTQRVHTDAVHMTAVRYVGFTQDDAMTTVTANCTSTDDATCDKALATLKVDGTKFKPLSSISDHNTVAYRIGVLVGALLVAALIGAYFLRRRSPTGR